METVVNSLPVLLLGAVKTLQITTISVFFGCILGLAAGLARLSQRKTLRFLSTCYVDFIRGTPLLVQVVIVYFGIPQLLREVQNYLVNSYGITPFFKNIPVFLAAVIACSVKAHFHWPQI